MPFSAPPTKLNAADAAHSPVIGLLLMSK